MHHPTKSLNRSIMLGAFLALGMALLGGQTMEGPQIQKGVLVISKAGLSSQAAFFPFTLDGIKMEVIALKAGDGSIRTALNTCQVCYDSGRGWYVQSGDQLICQNCHSRFGINQLELARNGCNPVPLGKELKSETPDDIRISAETLRGFKPFFARWKS